MYMCIRACIPVQVFFNRTSDIILACLGDGDVRVENVGRKQTCMDIVASLLVFTDIYIYTHIHAYIYVCI